MKILPKPQPKAPGTKVAAGVKPRPSFSLSSESELGAILSQANAVYGKGVMQLGKVQAPYMPRARTGILSLDLALAGGFLLSRGSMIYGEKSAGKTTIAMMAAIFLQRMYPDKVIVWFDIEGTFDWEWFVKLGGDPERLVISEPETGEQAIDMADAVARSKETAMLCTDSIAMLVSSKEIDDSAEDKKMGGNSILVGNYLRRVNNALLVGRHRDHRPLIMHINQFRSKVGLVFGDPRTLPGGRALEFSTTQQVEAKNKEHINEKTGLIMFNQHDFKITKDKTGGRLREGTFKLIRAGEPGKPALPEGYIDQIKSVLALGAEVGLVEGQYRIEGHGQFKSADLAQEYFLQRHDGYLQLQSHIINRFRKAWGLSVPPDAL